MGEDWKIKAVETRHGPTLTYDARVEPELVRRCLNCDYVLEHLSESRCPECGCAFDFNDPATFRAAEQRPSGSQRRWERVILIALPLTTIFLAASLFDIYYWTPSRQGPLTRKLSQGIDTAVGLMTLASIAFSLGLVVQSIRLRKRAVTILALVYVLLFLAWCTVFVIQLRTAFGSI